MSENQCPRCGHLIPRDDMPGAYPGALSRHDNKTYICSECGTDEAMRQFRGGPLMREFKGGPLDRASWFDRTGEEPEGIRRYNPDGTPK